MSRSDPSRSRPLRTRYHSVRLTPGENARLQAKAYVAGVALSTYLRRTALAHRIRGRSNRLEQEDVDRLNRLGRRLNDFARAANTARRIVGADELGELLAEIRMLARELRGRFE